MEDFRELRWIGSTPKHLDVVNTQFLLIGESSGLQKAMQAGENDQENADKEMPMDEMERLEEEDTARMNNLSKDSSTAIFADLEAQAKNYPKLQTTF